jgi:penicillin-binding protein 2
MLGGRRFNCAELKGHGRQNLREAIKHSCNVFFFKASEKIGQAPLTYYASMFGLGRETGVELSGETKGLVPDKNWKRRVISESWYDGDTLNFSIGQGYVLITPLQAAVLISAIANNGKLVQPYIVESVGEEKIKRPSPKQLPISLRTIDIIKDALYSVVESDDGTGINARVEGLSVSGKTGTAQATGHTSHGWFVGYAPSENPKVAIAVFIENGGYGGEVAAPIAGAVLKKMKQSGMF